MTGPQRVHAIVNPRSARGKTAKFWPDIEIALKARFPEVAVSFTDRAGAAIALTQRAVDEGADLIIAVGGDGTINEVVNGLHRNEKLINPDTELSILTIGTGSDFRKTLDIPADWQGALERISTGVGHKTDIGRVHLIGNDGNPATRYFINVTSFGLGGAVAHRVNDAKFSKLIGGTFSFYWNTIRTAMAYKSQRVRLAFDESDPIESDISVVAIANAQFFGGGMWVAPMAVTEDGKFDIITLHQSNFRQIAKELPKVYKGEHLELENVRHFTTKRLTASPIDDNPVLIETDGETPGRLPATFEILPGAITMRY